MGAGIDPLVFLTLWSSIATSHGCRPFRLLLDQGGAFIPVGSGHLQGRGGLIALLRAKPMRWHSLISVWKKCFGT